MNREEINALVKEIESSTFAKAKKRMESFQTLPMMLVSLSKDFPSELVKAYEKDVLICTSQHEDWTEEKILYHVAEVYDKIVTKKEKEYAKRNNSASHL